MFARGRMLQRVKLIVVVCHRDSCAWVCVARHVAALRFDLVVPRKTTRTQMSNNESRTRKERENDFKVVVMGRGRVHLVRRIRV